MTPAPCPICGDLDGFHVDRCDDYAPPAALVGPASSEEFLRFKFPDNPKFRKSVRPPIPDWVLEKRRLEALETPA